MKNFISTIILLLSLSACTHLNAYERDRLQSLRGRGITVDTPQTQWERPASPAAAGALNLLPGGGNFYLASGNAGDSNHYTYGFLNLITWPLSILWAVPEGAVDAQTINERDLLYHYNYSNSAAQK